MDYMEIILCNEKSKRNVMIVNFLFCAYTEVL